MVNDPSSLGSLVLEAIFGHLYKTDAHDGQCHGSHWVLEENTIFVKQPEIEQSSGDRGKSCSPKNT